VCAISERGRMFPFLNPSLLDEECSQALKIEQHVNWHAYDPLATAAGSRWCVCVMLDINHRAN
jgi:hypothetical protein